MREADVQPPRKSPRIDRMLATRARESRRLAPARLDNGLFNRESREEKPI